MVIVIFIRLLLTETLSDANASIAAKANEAAAAGSGASSFAPKRGYKLVSSSGGGGASSTTDTAATDDDDDDDDDDDGFTKMGIGKEEDGRSNGTGQSPAQRSSSSSSTRDASAATIVRSHAGPSSATTPPVRFGFIPGTFPHIYPEPVLINRSFKRR
eukprot:COSAG06_NODE_837_length_12033_cov_4.155574_6_plen_158_part_00